MQIFAHLDNADTAYVSIRLCRQEWQSLRAFMHTKEEFPNIGFPGGVRLFYRSHGWYRMGVVNPLDIVKKLKSTMGVLRRWYREYHQMQINETRLLLMKARPELMNVAFVSNDTRNGQFYVKNIQDSRENRVRSFDRLNEAIPRHAIRGVELETRQ